MHESFRDSLSFFLVAQCCLNESRLASEFFTYILAQFTTLCENLVTWSYLAERDAGKDSPVSFLQLNLAVILA